VNQLITGRVLALATALLGLVVAAPASAQPAVTATWSMMRPAPLERHEVAVVAMGDKIYVVGGEALGRED
jgi:hypothetical protein